MAWVTVPTFSPGEVLTAADQNKLGGNENELRGGGIAIASQGANDLIIASSATQLARVAAAADSVPYYTGSAWTMLGLGTFAAWTPAEAHVSLAVANGRYATLGKLTFLFFELTWPGTGDTNGVQINGLPVTVRNAIVSRGVGALYTDQGTAFVALPIEGTTHFLLYDVSGTQKTNANMSGKSATGVAIFEAA